MAHERVSGCLEVLTARGEEIEYERKGLARSDRSHGTLVDAEASYRGALENMSQLLQHIGEVVRPQVSTYGVTPLMSP